MKDCPILRGGKGDPISGRGFGPGCQSEGKSVSRKNRGGPSQRKTIPYARVKKEKKGGLS